MLIIANTALCAVLVLLSFLRVCYMTPDTRWSIVLGNAFMGAGAFAGGMAPIFLGMSVHPALLFMEAGYVALLLACQGIWSYPLPRAFLRHIPHIAEHHK